MGCVDRLKLINLFECRQLAIPEEFHKFFEILRGIRPLRLIEDFPRLLSGFEQASIAQNL